MPEVASRSDVQVLDNFIGGRWVKAHATDFFDVHNPAVGDVIGRTPLSTAADVDAAVQAAAQAFPASQSALDRLRTGARRSARPTWEQGWEKEAKPVLLPDV